MENKNSPASGISAYTDPQAGHGQDNSHSGYTGLTKREYIAAKAMQGIISANPTCIQGNQDIAVPKEVAILSAEFADALLKELEK